MPLYDAVKDLSVTIERVELEPNALSVKHFTRRTTVIHLHGAGHEGAGEDVSYDEDMQLSFTDEALPVPAKDMARAPQHVLFPWFEECIL